MHYEEDPSNFKKEFKVVFDDEDGVDAGGVRKVKSFSCFFSRHEHA
jgi:hypothetical protein